MELIVLNVARAPRGRSRKPGNVLLNWRKLLEIVPDTTLAAAGAVESRWLTALAALYVWNKLWRGAEEKLTDAEATIIFALWKIRNSESKVSMDDGFEHTNLVRDGFKLPPLPRGAYEEAIDRLLEMSCVELEDNWLWLREWVRIKYS
jgi:hypothetical protein